MLARSTRALLAATVVATFAAGGTLAALAASPEEAVAYRQGVFQNLKWNVAPLAAMAKGETEFNAAEAKLRAQRIATLSAMIVEGFPAGSDMQADSDALPEIWENKADFTDKAAALGETAIKLSSAASDLSAEELGPLVGAVAQACKACHDDYRAE